MKYFYKVAKQVQLRVDEVERNMGYYLPDKKEKKVKDMLEYEQRQHLGLRRPLLTGIPTLGIWPAMSRANAVDNVSKRVARQDRRAAQAFIDEKRFKKNMAMKNRELTQAYYSGARDYAQKERHYQNPK